jgi:hypothetical protein
MRWSPGNLKRCIFQSMVRALALTLVGPLHLALAQEVRDKPFGSSARLLSRSFKVDARGAIRVLCEGLAEDDLIVIRNPERKGQEREVRIVGGVFYGMPLKANQRLPLSSFPLFPLAGGYGPLPEDLLHVHGADVIVRRPSSLQGVVFLDLSVPEGVRVHLVVNGRSIINTVVSAPLLFSEGQLGVGPRNVAGTAWRAAVRIKETEEAVPLASPGEYAVPFHRLKVRRRVELGINAGQAKQAVLGIDETGRVVRALVFTDNGERDPQAEEQLRQWEFEPFFVNGQAVRVVTMLKIR